MLPRAPGKDATMQPYPGLLDAYLMCGPNAGCGVLLLHLVPEARPWRNPNNLLVAFVVCPSHEKGARLAVRAIRKFNERSCNGESVTSVRFSLTSVDAGGISRRAKANSNNNDGGSDEEVSDVLCKGLFTSVPIRHTPPSSPTSPKHKRTRLVVAPS
jgi:hypothetical protein